MQCSESCLHGEPLASQGPLHELLPGPAGGTVPEGGVLGQPGEGEGGRPQNVSFGLVPIFTLHGCKNMYVYCIAFRNTFFSLF